MFGDPVVFLIGSIFLIPALFIAIPVHELGHAAAAVAMGDPSPRNRGYFRRLDPRGYMNVYGIVAAFLANVTWGNPVPVNEYRLSGAGRKVVYALGGPLANLLAAVVFGLIVRALAVAGVFPNWATFLQPALGWVATICFAMFFLNLATFAFQLLPIPGLDGWRIARAVFAPRNAKFFFQVDANIQTVWMVLFVALLLSVYILHFSLLNLAVSILFQPASNGILGTCSGYVALDPCLL